MARIEGSRKVQEALKKQKAKYGPARQSVIVGYTQNYALYVHENLEAAHGSAYNAKYKSKAKGKGKGTKLRGSNQQAKYLEKPFRELAGDLAKIVITITKKTKNLTTGLLYAGLRLQRESQKIVPVDTGALKASAFTREEQ